MVRLPRFVPLMDPKAPPTYLLFADVADGKPDFFRGEVCTPAAADYLAGLTKLDGKDRVRLMRYCGDFLEHADPVVAADAFHEFLKSADPDIRTAGRNLNPDPIRRWLTSKKTPSDRLRLYAFLLAQCGDQADAKLLRGLLDRRIKGESPPQMDGVLTAYTLLDREAAGGRTRAGC